MQLFCSELSVMALSNCCFYQQLFKNCWREIICLQLPRLYFFTPRFRFFNLRYGFLHFLHLVASISFLQPQLKQILITKRACCAILFFSGSVIGIRFSPCPTLFYSNRLFPSFLQAKLALLPVFWQQECLPC